MHFIPSVLTEKNSKVLVCVLYPQDMQGSRCNSKMLILPAATDLFCTQFHLFMNTIITAGRSELSYCFSRPHPYRAYRVHSVAMLGPISDWGLGHKVCNKCLACVVLSPTLQPIVLHRLEDCPIKP